MQTFIPRDEADLRVRSINLFLMLLRGLLLTLQKQIFNCLYLCHLYASSNFVFHSVVLVTLYQVKVREIIFGNFTWRPKLKK